jgi:hypothetical protein
MMLVDSGTVHTLAAATLLPQPVHDGGSAGPAPRELE